MDIQKTSETLIHKNIIKSYILVVGNKTIKLEKWMDQNMKDGMTGGFVIENEKEVREVLLPAEWEQLVAFINNLTLE